MQFDEALLTWPVESADSGEFTFVCPCCLGLVTCVRGLDDDAVFECSGGCKAEEILGDKDEILQHQSGPTDNGNMVSEVLRLQTGRTGGDVSEKEELNDETRSILSMAGNGQAQENSHTNGLAKPDVFSWKAVLYEYACQACDKAIRENRDARDMIAAMPLTAFVETVQRVRNTANAALTYDPELSETEIEEEVRAVAQAVQKVYAPLVVDKPEKPVIIWEDQEIATRTNAEYLARPEIIEKLGYSQSMAMMIGAKHHGKTTNVRTLALSVLRGLPIWKRSTHQGPVIYVASDDEVASTRNELLNMGWQDKNEPLYFAHMDPASEAEPEQVLEHIAEKAIKVKAVLIILDMLFDFVAIKDELSYAGTRGPLQTVQFLADNTKALIVCSHHTPKYLNDMHNAANAALGSQGISARFSPIILTRKWTENLFTVESTTVRDPRGEALKAMKITKNAGGWIETGDEFKEYMKWEIYAQRVIDLFDSPQRGLTVFSIAEKLGIDRARIQNTVKEMEESGKLKREKIGRSYRYYLANSDMFQRQRGNWNQ